MIRKLAGPEVPPLPAFLRGPDWERACRGLLAVAVNNRDGAFAKPIDLGRPEDAVVLSFFKGVDHWTFSRRRRRCHRLAGGGRLCERRCERR